MCVCVCERERERECVCVCERERERERGSGREEASVCEKDRGDLALFSAKLTRTIQGTHYRGSLISISPLDTISLLHRKLLMFKPSPEIQVFFVSLSLSLVSYSFLIVCRRNVVCSE